MAPASASASASASAATSASAAVPALPFDVIAVGWRADSRVLGIGHLRGALLVPGGDGPTTSIEPAGGRVTAIGFSPGGEQVATVTNAGNVHLWTASNGALITELPRSDPDPRPVFNGAAVAFSTNGAWLAAVSDRVRLWHLEDRKQACSWDSNSVFELRFAPDGRSLVSTGGGSFKRWDTSTCAALDDKFAETGGTFGSVLSPDGTWMAAAEDTGHSLSLFTTSPFRRKGSYARSASCDDHVNPVRFSRDGRLLLVTGNTRWFRSFRVGTFAVAAAWKMPAGDPPESVTPFDDGVHLIVRAASGDTTVLDTLAPSKRVVLQPSGATAFDTSPDSAWFVGMTDRTAFLWETATGKLVRTLQP